MHQHEMQQSNIYLGIYIIGYYFFWKNQGVTILQELGYEKQPKYYGTQLTCEGSEPVCHVQVYIFIPMPLRRIF
jgi:hypothetical protein